MTLTAHKGKNELSLQSEKVVVDGNKRKTGMESNQYD